MSIFQKQPIRVGDLVIGVGKYGYSRSSGPQFIRHFEEPSIVLEIKEDKALVFFEQQGPLWYDINKLERAYVSEEFDSMGSRRMAPIEFNHSDQPRNQDDVGNDGGDN